ncbi:phospholipase D family protein [Ectobacillus funiculus]|uniref:phospholipase D family protein n=1 Tax=Ectobacillus funiculus TaxID=137993 RepID=UPI0013EDCB38|nr:phospholipase D family protein [Ectobacillus funiculus]
MPKFLGSEFKNSISKDLKSCKQSITIISPYITQNAVRRLIETLPSCISSRLFITLPPGPEYVIGTVEVEGLELLAQAGFELRYLENLHAKIYLLDQKYAYIGSANLTSSGWELIGKSGEGNVEDMVRLPVTELDFTHVKKRYIVPSEFLDLKGEWRYEVEKYKKQLLKQYQEALNGMKIERKPKNFTMFSRYQFPPKDDLWYFQFSLAKTTGYLVKKEKQNFIFKLGGDEKNPDATLFVPYKKVGKFLTEKYLDGARKSWQFRIGIDLHNQITFRIKEERVILDRDLEGDLQNVYPK